MMMPELDGFGLAMALRQDPGAARRAARARDVELRRVVRSRARAPRRRERPRAAHARSRRADRRAARRRSPTSTPVRSRRRRSCSPELERERNRRVFRQLERQVMLNTGLAKRCSRARVRAHGAHRHLRGGAASNRDVDVALDEALAELLRRRRHLVRRAVPARGRRAARAPARRGHRRPSEPLATFFGHEALLRDVIDVAARRSTSSAASEIAELGAAARPTRSAKAILIVPLSSTGGPARRAADGVARRELDEDDWRAFAHGVATQISQVLDARARVRRRARPPSARAERARGAARRGGRERTRLRRCSSISTARSGS